MVWIVFACINIVLCITFFMKKIKSFDPLFLFNGGFGGILSLIILWKGFKEFFPFISRHESELILVEIGLLVVVGVLVYILQLLEKKKIIVKEINENAHFTKRKRNIIVATTILSFVLLGVVRWSNLTFGSLTFESIVFTLQAAGSGTPLETVVNVGMSVLASVFIGSILLFFVVKKRKYFIGLKTTTKTIMIRFPFRWLRRFGSILSTVVLAVIIGYTATVFDLGYLLEPEDSFIKDTFVDPSGVKMTFPAEKRNLIYIFLESYETTAFLKEDGGGMDVDLTPNLTQLLKEEDVYRFSNTESLAGGFQDVYGTGWSMAGMVSQLGGIPLKVGINANVYGEQYNFLPGNYNLGDILYDEGYDTTFTVGMDAEFAGVRNFYETHGNFKVYDRAYFEGIHGPAQDEGPWGMSDQLLYKYSKDIILEAANSGKPFVNIIENIDTHEPGYVNPTCPTPTGNKHTDSFACMDKEVVEMVRWIQEQPFYENTTIVLYGDHLSWADPFPEVPDDYQRTTFGAIINPSKSAIKDTTNFNNRIYYGMDIFPTVLASLGVEVEGDRLGMGTNLFSNLPTILEQNGIDVVEKHMRGKSEFYTEKFVQDEK